MRPTLLWFKRDLRLQDHAALCDAARRGPVLPLAIVEPQAWRQPDSARQHYEFLAECLQDLQAALAEAGCPLLIQVGEACEVLERLWQAQPFEALVSHEETGNDWSHARDRAVAAWCRLRGVRWTQHASGGVVRALRDRDGWRAHWTARMAAPLLPVPALQPAPWPLPAQALPGWGALVPERAQEGQPPQRQRGGRRRALRYLQGFLDDRAAQYRGGISSPLSARTACSRLSPYLAWGCLSLREVVQASEDRLASAGTGRLAQGLRAFQSRLAWHDHFIQKLESEPEQEWRNLHRGYDGLREGDWRAEHFEALQAGRTGWPLVDACVAQLRETGWLNFRMRAMLVSVASYPLWLHWREVGLWLARQFLDYEPGIHWPQMQMQAGTTGINTTRVYNPVKQAQDQDPQGHYVRHWLPWMRAVPDSWLFEPWRMPPALRQRPGLQGGTQDLTLPLPLVDLEQASREARARMHARRAEPGVRAARADILRRHASRDPAGWSARLDSTAPRGHRPAGTGPDQLSLEL